ncbi:MAG: hypothetical protein RMI90_15090 [Thermoguttaceae bacterium]|nr:hypothetical protein [Thermoguttaceae bacterium]
MSQLWALCELAQACRLLDLVGRWGLDMYECTKRATHPLASCAGPCC